MLNLSDPILFDISSRGTEYKNYTLSIGTPTWFSSAPQYQLIHTGRIYTYKRNQKLYVNDILSSYADNYSWMSYDRVRDFNSSKTRSNIMDVSTRAENRVTCTVQLQCDGSTKREDVILRYDDPRNNITSKDSTWYQSSSADEFNFLQQRTNVIPRLPRLGGQPTDFFVGGLFAVNQGWRANSMTQGNCTFRVVLLDPDKRVVAAENDIYAYPIYNLTSPIQSVLIGGYLIDGATPNYFISTKTANHYLAISPTYRNSSGDIIPSYSLHTIILGQFDECNADYYLIWCDRTGGYQCQRFNEKTTLNEDITTTTLTNMIGDERAFQKLVNVSYDLKSDWLNFEEYKAFESIFTSPYLYLFDTKFNKLTPVTCSGKKWVEKTSKNTNKPFNLQIKLTSNRPQNIIY